MRILITGAKGNVGRGLMAVLTSQAHEVIGTDVDEMDITDYATTLRTIELHRPALVIHCAAMTAVDRCAVEPDLAITINALGARHVALACAKIGAAMCQISTNEVFDRPRNIPILEYDVTNPANPYGYSKWLAEQMIRDILPQHYIVRTSWLFAHGGTNFLQKILQAAQAGKPLAVVVDEVAAPTYTNDLIDAIAALITTERYGIYHFVNAGHASRYDFARCALDYSGFTATPIRRIISAQFPRASHPPTYSVLRNFIGAQMGITLRDWQSAVRAFLDQERLNDSHGGSHGNN